MNIRCKMLKFWSCKIGSGWNKHDMFFAGGVCTRAKRISRGFLSNSLALASSQALQLHILHVLKLLIKSFYTARDFQGTSDYVARRVHARRFKRRKSVLCSRCSFFSFGYAPRVERVNNSTLISSTSVGRFGHAGQRTLHYTRSHP